MKKASCILWFGYNQTFLFDVRLFSDEAEMQRERGKASLNSVRLPPRSQTTSLLHLVCLCMFTTEAEPHRDVVIVISAVFPVAVIGAAGKRSEATIEVLIPSKTFPIGTRVSDSSSFHLFVRTILSARLKHLCSRVE